MRKIYLLSNTSKEKLKTLDEALAKDFENQYSIDEEKFMLKINISDEEIEEQTALLTSIITTTLPNCNVVEKEVAKVSRRVLILQGLDCANCAAKIERIAKRTLNHEYLCVDFATSKFIIETSDKSLEEDLINRVKNITSHVDPNIKVVSPTDKNANPNDFKISRLQLLMFVIGAACFCLVVPLRHVLSWTGVYDMPSFLVIILYGIAYAVLGYDVLYGAFKNIISGRVFDEKFLMTLATLCALGIGYYEEAVCVMIFYKVGTMLQLYAVNKSRRSIHNLLAIRPSEANLIIGDELVTTNPADIVIGDIILVKRGERIPLDGVVIEGEAALDTSALTGEARYLDVEPGMDVVSGSINTNGIIKIKVTKTYNDSTVTKMLSLVENASSLKSKTENFISKFAKYYTPVVCAIALIYAISPLFFGHTDWESFQVTIHDALIMLVISCPCALVISIPLSYFGGIGGASKRGILIKGSNFLEKLSNIGCIAFDKTGTITEGSFHVEEIVPLKEEYTKLDILKLAAYAEFTSLHPIGKSIIEEYGESKIDSTLVRIHPDTSKYGSRIYLGEDDICVGNERHFEKSKIKYKKVESTGVVVYVAKNNECIGYIIVKDKIREDAKEVIERIKSFGIKTAIITGDKENVAMDVAEQMGIDEVYANMMPIEKVKRIRKLKKNLNGKKVVFVGDGINDAPVLSASDVGIAMGKLGSDAAIEVADVVLMNDDLTKLPTLVQIAKKTKFIVVENIIISLAIKFIVLAIVAFGLLDTFKFAMFLGIFADVGVSLIATINSLRAARIKEEI